MRSEETNVHDIPYGLSAERLKLIVHGEVEHLRPLNRDELADIIFTAAVIIEQVPEAVKFLDHFISMSNVIQDTVVRLISGDD